jgi:cbb3-type cytochrome oxidase subunit 3
MKLSDIVSGAGLAMYAEIALLMFFVVFLAILMRTLFANRESLERAARMPLEDEQTATSDEHHPTDAPGAPGA